MKEISKVLSIDEFFSDCDTHPHEERLRVAHLMIHQKVVLRRLYLKYSMILVSSPEKAFQMSRPQFVRFVKDCGILGKKVDNAVVDEIFALSNMEVENGKTITTGVKIDPTNPANVMMPDEFCEAVVRLCERLLRDEVRPLTRRLEQLFENHLAPLADKDFDISEPE